MMNEHKTSKVHERMAHKSILLMPAPLGSAAVQNKILAPMIHDQVARVVKNYPLFLELTKWEYSKVGHDGDQHNHVRTKLREMGQLLIQLRIQTNIPNASLKAFINAQNFKEVAMFVISVGLTRAITCTRYHHLP